MHEKEKYIIRKNIGEELFEILTNNKCILAGGAITSIFSGSKINDYDIYFHTKEGLEGLQKDFEWKDKNDITIKLEASTKILFETENAITISIDNKTFQLIRMEEVINTDTTKIINQFDFTICMGAYDFASNEFIFDNNFFKHLAQRNLVYNIDSNYPFASLHRVNKYLKRGFKISGIEMLKIALKCNSIKIDNFKALRRQLMGIDTLFLKELTDQLNSDELAGKAYDFELFLHMMEEHLAKVHEFSEE